MISEFVGRFDSDIPLPDENARRRLFSILLEGVKVEEGIDWGCLVERTGMYSGDDINNVCRDASMMPLRRELTGKADGLLGLVEMQGKLKEVPISMQDFMDALDFVKPTNGKEKLEKYKRWMEEFGST